ncbi:MAG: DUF4870 domain-containing protein [Verrucomicrobiota bacterium]
MNGDNDSMGVEGAGGSGAQEQLQATGGLSKPQKDERLWGILAHLTALSTLLGVPFGNVLGPLVVWLIKKEDSPWVDAHGKASLNFQISMTIYMVVFLGIGVLTLVFLIGFLFLFVAMVLGIVWAVCTLIASVQASNGEVYRYPCTIRFFQ